MMLQEQYRNEVPQELSALMELQQGMQTGKVAPTTPQGQPTVAAQMAGAAQQQMAPQMAPQMPMGSPAVNQVAQQAGLAAQIQAMRQQQMQQAMMQQAAQAQQRPQMMAAGGVASLNPNIRGFKRGGIIGYAGDDESYAIEEPATPGGGLTQYDPTQFEGYGVEETGASRPEMREAKPEEMTMERAFELGIAAQGRAKPKEITPQQIVERAMAGDAASREYLKAQGIDVDYLKTAAEQSQRQSEERAKYYENLARTTKEEQGRTALRDFMLGARGRRFGDVMAAGARAAIGSEQAAQNRIERLTEAKFEIQASAIKEKRLLEQARYQTAMGQFGAAQKSLEQAEVQRQNREQQEANLYKAYGQTLGAGERAERRAEAVEYGADVRAETARYLADVRERLGLARAGSGGREPIVRRVETDPQGNKIAIMSDGSPRPLGFKSADFEYRIGKMQQQLLKDGPPGYRRLPYEEQRQIATEYVVGKSVAPAAGGETPPPSAAPGAAPTGGRVMTMDDVRATAAKSGRTVQEVMDAAKAKGFTIQQ